MDNNYNREFQLLPNFVEIVQLPKYYSKQIKKIPKGFKKIICWKNYKYIDDFKNYLIETY